MAEGAQCRRPAALFRLEFGGARGWGHLVRSGALAAECRRRGWRCDPWTASDPAGVPGELREPFDGTLAYVGDAASVPVGYDWLVVDDYGADDERLGAWRRAFAGRILAIDDEARRSLVAADLVVNARLGLAESPYGSGVRALLGARHALLRPGLREPVAPAVRPQAGAGLTAVLVMLGGTDPTGSTAAVLDTLADVDPAGLVPVVVRPGARAPQGAEAAALARFRGAVWLDGVNARELAGWVGQCGFAVSAAGGTLYELAALRLPFVAVVVAENQRRMAEAVEAWWRMPRVEAGPRLRETLADAVCVLRDDLQMRREALAAAEVDLDGAVRVADAMAAMSAPR